MTDTPKLEPALTAQEWAAKCVEGREASSVLEDDSLPGVRIEDGVLKLDTWDPGVAGEVPPERAAAVIALLNDTLRADDPRKITRERVRLLRALTTDMRTIDLTPAQLDVELRALADALESYLPPEP